MTWLPFVRPVTSRFVSSFLIDILAVVPTLNELAHTHTHNSALDFVSTRLQNGPVSRITAAAVISSTN